MNFDDIQYFVEKVDSAKEHVVVKQAMILFDMLANAVDEINQTLSKQVRWQDFNLKASEQ